MRTPPIAVVLALCALQTLSCLRATGIDRIPVSPEARAAVEPTHLVLVATNDWHGQLYATKEAGGEARGGAPAFFALLTALRTAFPERLVWIDAGGSLTNAGWTEEPTRPWAIEAFSRMGLDFGTLGEADFVAAGGEEATQEALQADIARATFPWSSANLYAQTDGRRPAWMEEKPALVERQGLRIGFIGLTTPRAAERLFFKSGEGFYFGEMGLAARERAQHLRESGADIIILSAYAAGACTRERKAEKGPPLCEEGEGELWQLLDALPEGLIDVVVAGQAEPPLAHSYRGIPVLRTRGLGKELGLIHLYWEPTRRKLLREETHLALADIGAQAWPQGGDKGAGAGEAPAKWLEAQPRDEAFEAWLAPGAQRFHEAQAKAWGVSLGEPLSLEGEASPLGSLWAEGLQQATQADVALVPRALFRAGLEAGPLKGSALQHSMPYESRVVLAGFSGEALKRLMQLAYGQKAWAFDTAGVQVALSCFPSGRRRVRTRLRGPDGQTRAVEDKALYWVAMPEFMARGGGGLEGLADGRMRELKPQGRLREGVLAFWRQRRAPLRAPVGQRILWEEAREACMEEDKR